MKYIPVFLFIVFVGCQPETKEDEFKDEVISVAGECIKEYASSIQDLRIKGEVTVEKELKDSSLYHIKGSVEGFSSFNVPVSDKKFSETLHYIGGDPNKRASWECMEIMIGNEKIK